MKISYNWLKQYINTDLNPDEIAKILINTGLEVENIEKFETVKGGLEGLTIGKVLSCKKHPNADKLTCTTVDIGKGNVLSIVCGASNVAEGQKVVVATEGTKLYIGDKEITIAKTKMRGEPSEGMICAEDEIGLGTSHAGIMVLDEKAQTGTPAKEYFKVESDTVFEIGITPNRIDGASHIGTARDVVAFLNQTRKIELVKPSVDKFKVDNQNFKIDIVIENPEACPRYTGITVSNVKVEKSPAWLQNRLKAIGLNPINNLVDISNYILHETGQPLHFFDADKIEGKKVVVKTLTEGTSFQTLDEQERKLSPDDLMICNENGGMCIAGVFGGLKSGVTENTKNVFIESAHFNPVYIRKTAKRHGLHTDASFRFERGTDPNATVYVLKRAALLIKEIAGGEISSEIIDVYPKPVTNQIVDLTFKNLKRLIGKEIEKEKVKKILNSLDIKIISEDSEKLNLEIPTYRVDVTREADVIEEILRIYGYNNVEISEHVNSSLSYSNHPDKEKIQNSISDFLSFNGFNEIMCNSLTKADYYSDLNTMPESKLVKIVNPLSSDLGVMRQSLLFGGLESIEHNRNRKNKDLKLYEFGKSYYLKESKSENPLKKYAEDFQLALLITGNKTGESWIAKEEPASFYQLKSYVENILEKLGFDLDAIELSEIENDIFIEGLKYELNKNQIVEFGILSKKILKRFDIDSSVYFACFNWDNVLKVVAKHTVRYKEIPKYPEVRRDLALLLDKDVRFEKIKALAYKTEKSLLKKVSLFDVFEGEKLGKDKKSYAVSFILQDETKTLTDKQIDKIMNNFIRVFEQELSAKIR
ncbi:MAG: phenylalanine--tRNA ligase subunit beta [Bacteroidetes bacterium GWC2_33_15]|nr:MAG: phenylalanine--tRNA ligase subunit beta [Bacteroidetes bacterium GWA2_33_15]OFX51033.1 MAG: phenylalanine--tRNA ligase subunit beta [Bacteroidetes bacterium GWC2_33_15]OFX65656.1 MAG: phenylalanine--tRNA ligase subunit beta [Bacteroidetes bacterium GWB2_32_14]OFX70241.1 MAG: phenylalanine--tRNA ligase subunit beta [Bacteroidetes bacterium GWD2_33_33]HAN17237.1 phenylalanine--tRNA ligase subunit beta [Bacteroidales bacterium]